MKVIIILSTPFSGLDQFPIDSWAILVLKEISENFEAEVSAFNRNLSVNLTKYGIDLRLLEYSVFWIKLLLYGHSHSLFTCYFTHTDFVFGLLVQEKELQEAKEILPLDIRKHTFV